MNSRKRENKSISGQINNALIWHLKDILSSLYLIPNLRFILIITQNPTYWNEQCLSPNRINHSFGSGWPNAGISDYLPVTGNWDTLQVPSWMEAQSLPFCGSHIYPYLSPRNQSSLKETKQESNINKEFRAPHVRERRLNSQLGSYGFSPTSLFQNFMKFKLKFWPGVLYSFIILLIHSLWY